MTIPFDRSFGYIFKKPHWVNSILLAAVFTLFSLILVGLPFLNGYMIKIIRFRLKGNDDLPDWSDLGQIFVDGIKVTFVTLVHALPFLFMAALIFLGIFLVDESEVAGLVVFLVAFPLQIILTVYSLWLVLVYPLIYHVIAKDQPLSHAFHHRTFWRVITQDWKNALLALLFYYLAGIISSIGLFFFFIGYFFTFPYYLIVVADIYGKLLKHWEEKKLLK